LEESGSGVETLILSILFLDMVKKIVVVVVLVLAAAWFGNRSAAQKERASTDRYDGWAAYGGGPDNIHFSSLKQINRENVGRLSVAWNYDTRDALEGADMQCNPVIVNGVLYATSPKLRVFALDAATGKLLWEAMLPFAGNATPATYEVDGRQFVVIAAGGGKRGAPSGGTYVAFALPH
jgi:glucose dehydrogenase